MAAATAVVASAPPIALATGSSGHSRHHDHGVRLVVDAFGASVLRDQGPERPWSSSIADLLGGTASWY